MTDAPDLKRFLADARIDPEVLALRPDYRAALLVVDGIDPAASTALGDALVAEAEASARELLAAGPVEEEPHVAAWREAYRGFGAKPQRTRNSLEALLRRAGGDAGLPRVNALTDVYNAISVLHRIPLGGEDLTRYRGSARLVRATGAEEFDAVAGGVEVVEHPEPGEVVWRDDAGVTCRRWNWRQGRRTALTGGTTAALFILDALAPVDDAALDAAVDHLATALGGLGADVTSATRTVGAA